MFSVGKVGQIAGASVTDGKITRQCRLRLIREGKQLHEGKMGSLRRFKDDVKEVAQGFEFGISIEGFNDVQVGDIIEGFEMEVIRSKLEGVPDPAAGYRAANVPEVRA